MPAVPTMAAQIVDTVPIIQPNNRKLIKTQIFRQTGIFLLWAMPNQFTTASLVTKDLNVLYLTFVIHNMLI